MFVFLLFQLLLLPRVSAEVSIGLPMIARSVPIDRVANSSGNFQLTLVQSWDLIAAQIIEQEGRRFAALHGDVSKQGSPGYVSHVLSFAWASNNGTCVIQCVIERPFRLIRAWRPADGEGMLRAELQLFNMQTPMFGPGQVVHHKKYNYTGVVLAADPVCMAQPDWTLNYYGTFDNPLLDQPFYSLLPDERDRDGGLTTYVEEANVVKLEPALDDFQHRRRNSMLGFYHTNVGRYDLLRSSDGQVNGTCCVNNFSCCENCTNSNISSST